MIVGAAAMLGDLVAFAQWWRPDVVVYEAVSYAGAVTAAVLGVPGVRLLFGLGFLATPGVARRTSIAGVLPAVRPVRCQPHHRAALTVDPTPPSMRLADAEPPWKACVTCRTTFW